MFIFLEAFKDPFVITAEAASQSSSGTRANLHKVEAAEEGLLLGRISRVHCLPGASASSRAHDASFDSTAGNPSKAQIFTKNRLSRD